MTLFWLKEFNEPESTIESKLKKKQIRNLTGNEEKIWGFSKDNNGMFHKKVNGLIIINIECRTKNVPKSTLDRALQKKLQEMSKENPNEWSQENLTKSQVAELKDIVHCDLLTKAFTVYKSYTCIINPIKSMVLIDSISDNVNDSILSLIRDSFVSFPVSTIQSTNISSKFISWLAGKIPNKDFQINDGDITLKEDDRNGSIAKYNSQDLKSDEITLNLQSSKVPIEISLKWKDELQFNLKDNLKISKIKTLGTMKSMLNQSKDQDGNDKDTSLFIVYIEYFKMITDLIKIIDIKKSIDDTNNTNKDTKFIIEEWEKPQEN